MGMGGREPQAHVKITLDCSCGRWLFKFVIALVAGARGPGMAV